MHFVRDGLGIGAVAGLLALAGVGVAAAECGGHPQTTAQSQKPVQVAQTTIPSTTPQSGSVQSDPEEAQQE